MWGAGDPVVTVLLPMWLWLRLLHNTTILAQKIRVAYQVSIRVRDWVIDILTGSCVSTACTASLLEPELGSESGKIDCIKEGNVLLSYW